MSTEGVRAVESGIFANKKYLRADRGRAMGTNLRPTSCFAA